MRWPIPLLVLCASGFPVGAVAQVYKCADDAGPPVYQDKPCPEGRELRNFTADPAPVSVLPLDPPGTTSRRVAPPAAKAGPKAPQAKDRAGHPRAGDPAQRRYLHPGMVEGEVIARVGPPDMKSGTGRKIARWTYMPAAGDPQTLTTVVLDTGKVIEVERRVVP